MIGRRLALFAALAVAALVLGPAVDARADASFAWHMLQHLMLLLAVPLLLVLARPFDDFVRYAPKPATVSLLRALRPLHALAGPRVAFPCFVATLWVTHFSGWYEAALEHPLIHLAGHALYLAAGTLFWLPVLAPPPLRPLPYPARLFYLFLALPQGALLGAALAGARAPLYAYYAAHGVAAALADQQAAAALMWIGGGLTIFTALLITFGVWAARESRALHSRFAYGDGT